MSEERSRKRRAVITGLTPYLNDAELARALDHWEASYASLARPTLQKFVFEIAADAPLRRQRSNILLSLVKAMNLPADKLLPDPAERKYIKRELEPSEGAAAAFVVLVTALMEKVPAPIQYSFRLDLLDSLNNPHLPDDLVKAFSQWLNQARPLVIHAAQPVVLRALTNRTYVVLCERVGPVEADRMLAQAINHCQTCHPALAQYLTDML